MSAVVDSQQDRGFGQLCMMVVIIHQCSIVAPLERLEKIFRIKELFSTRDLTLFSFPLLDITIKASSSLVSLEDAETAAEEHRTHQLLNDFFLYINILYIKF